VKRVEIDRTIGDRRNKSDAHRMAVLLTFVLQRPEDFTPDDDAVLLEEILVNLHPKDESDDSIPDDPTSASLID